MIRPRLVLAILAGTFAAGLASAEPPRDHRGYDARRAFNRNFRVPARPESTAALARRSAGTGGEKDLSLSWDETTGALRSLSHHTGFLSATGGRAAEIAATRGAAAEPLAFDYVRANVDLLGLDAADLEDLVLADRVFSPVTGLTHLYWQQRHAGLRIYNAQLQVNVHSDGRILGVNNSFLPRAARATAVATPRLGPSQAVRRALADLGITVAAPAVTAVAPGAERHTTLRSMGVSQRPLAAKLMWLPVRAGLLKLVWNFDVATLDGQHWYDFTVDAITGKVWTRFDWVDADSYRVYAAPAESPNHTPGRTVVSGPADGTASPFGWHDTNGAAGAEYTVTRGNNAHAYTDVNNDNSPDAGSSPSGGASLDFDFALDLTQAPSAYRPAAVTNLFYWNNIIHDIQYQYGFDEAGGNFQVNNYGRGGLGNDYVHAEAQDGSGTNNANFGTPPDGASPLMQMYVWTSPTPDRDGDLDAGIVIHEYGHGISNRLVGGPSNVSCLDNNQQPGEGLSDWWALVYTAQGGSSNEDRTRGMGTYALNQPVTGNGIRGTRYSTDPRINSWTYASINGRSIPHGVGAVWAQGAWEMYWALVDEWGWSPDLYDATGSAGNQRAMLYVNEGLKNTACSPTFTQVRDGIIQAATALHGGQDVCRIWSAFAAFGLGTNAVSGGSGSTTPTNGFAVPGGCPIVNVKPIADAGSDQAVAVGTLVTLDGSASLDPDSYPGTFTRSWSQTSGPSVTLSSTSAAKPTFTASAAGTYVFEIEVGDGEDTSTDSVTIRAATDVAVYDSALGAPKCATPGSACEAGTLLVGRGTMGPEPHQPNTLGSCTDGSSGAFHEDESNDWLRVKTLDDTVMAAGKTVQVDATVWVYDSGADRLDLYYAANANSPTWTLIGTVTPPSEGSQTLTRTYTLPTGALQAVRARFRYQGSASACGTGNYNDHDDLVFAVSVVDTSDPTVSLTSPADGATIGGVTTLAATATDDVGVTLVEFYDGATLLGTDSTSPYSITWDTTGADGPHTLTAVAHDGAANSTTSAAVAVTVNNSTPELLFNGSFDRLRSPWVRTASFAWMHDAGAQSGTGYLATGNVNGVAATAYQQVNIPLSAVGSLSFWTDITTAETTATAANDKLYVEVRSTTGALLGTVATYSNLDAGGGWVQRAVDLYAYRGKTVRLQFRVATNASLPTVFRLDTVSLK